MLVRAFSIVTALLLRRAVVGGGLFLDPVTVKPKTVGSHRKAEGAAAEEDKEKALAVMGTGRCARLGHGCVVCVWVRRMGAMYVCG